MRKRIVLPVSAFAAASVWCVVLLAVREHEFGASGYPFLVWNLTLAWIPLALAGLLAYAYARGRSTAELAVVGGAWLLFLPNAPYVLTDFVNLNGDHPLFDALVIGSFAVTALALGFASLLLVQLVVTRLAGALAGWVTVVVSLFAAAVGIYLGRVLRFNSWDVVQRPHALLVVARDRLDDPFGNRYLIGYVLLLGGFLVLAYAGLYGMSALGTAVRREPPTRR
jgi:uncharacterized membrane protein